MAMRPPIIPNVSSPHVIEMLKFSLWGPEIFPEEAFENLRNRNPGKNLEALLSIKAKLPGDVQASAAGISYSRATETSQKKEKVNQHISKTHPSQNKQGWNRRGSRGGKKNQRGNKNKQINSGNGKPNQARQNQNRNNNEGKPLQKGKKESNK